jgi:putative flippase GtrA
VKLALPAFGRFLIVGGANTLLTWGIYWAALPALGYQLAFLLAFGVGILFSAAAHSRLSFGLRLGRTGFVAYALYCVAFYFFCAGVLEALVAGVGVPAVWGNVLVTLIGLPVNFFCSRWMMSRYGSAA